MRTLYVVLAAGLSGCLLQSAPVVQGVNNAASGGLNISPGCLISIYGTDLAATKTTARAGKLPTTLGETSVSIAGIAAPLTYVSPTQINAQVPFEAATGPSTLTVTTGQGISTPFPISHLIPTSPGVFKRSDVLGQALVLTPAFHVANTIRSGDVIIFYATGLGQTNPPTATGALGAPAEPLNRLPNLPAVWIGANPAKVLFAGMAPGFPVYQINVEVPTLPTTDQIYLTTADASDVASITFANNNVSNVHASVNLIYPSASSQITYSPILVVASYSLNMDVSPTARPFQIGVEIDGSNAVSTLTVDPTAGTLAGKATVPTAATREGDFSNSGLSTLDFTAQGPFPNTQSPFPNNVIPRSRMDPAALTASSNLPSGTASSSDWSIVTYSFSGTFAPGPSFTFGSSAPGAQFGGFMTTFQDPPSHSIDVGASLFVDGVKVASTAVTVTTI